MLNGESKSSRKRCACSFQRLLRSLMQYTSQCQAARNAIESLGPQSAMPARDASRLDEGPQVVPNALRATDESSPRTAWNKRLKCYVHQLLHLIPHRALMPWDDSTHLAGSGKTPSIAPNGRCAVGQRRLNCAVPRLHRNHNQERAVKRTPRLTRLFSPPCSMHRPGA